MVAVVAGLQDRKVTEFQGCRFSVVTIVLVLAMVTGSQW